MLFADLLSLHLVTFLMFFILVHVPFFSSRCMLELKFAIYYRAASLPSQASYARAEVCHLLLSSKFPLTGFLCSDQTRLSSNTPHTPNSISNSATLHNNYISLLSDLCTCVHGNKKWRRKGSHSSSVSGSNRLV